MRAKAPSILGIAVRAAPKILAITALIVSPAVAQARPMSLQLAVEDIQDTENCGINAKLVSEAMTELAKARDLKLKRSRADFVLFADVNVLGIPNSLGVWSKACSFNINIEVQRHQELEIDRLGKVLTSAKLCDSGYTGYITDGNLGFFSEAIERSFAACLAELPAKVAKAIAR